MIDTIGEKYQPSSLEKILKNRVFQLICVILFVGSYFFQRYYRDLDEEFISEILRNDTFASIFDPFWLLMFWTSIALFILSIVVYFMFSNKRSTSISLLIIVVLGGIFLGDGLKSLFDLPRPPQVFTEWIPDAFQDFIPTNAETNDFPAQSIMMAAGFFSYFVLKKPTKMRIWILGLYFVISFFTRPYLGINHISANIAGAIMGLYLGLFAFEFTDKSRNLPIFNSKITRFLSSVIFFIIMFFIYTLQRPYFHTRAAQGVDLDIRMFMMVLGGFIGIAITEYPKELIFGFSNFGEKLRYFLVIVFCYVILFAVYFVSLSIPEEILWVGIIIGFIDGLWISIGGPYVVERIMRNYVSETSST